jgi:hypothetical protein
MIIIAITKIMVLLTIIMIAVITNIRLTMHDSGHHRTANQIIIAVATIIAAANVMIILTGILIAVDAIIRTSQLT